MITWGDGLWNILRLDFVFNHSKKKNFSVVVLIRNVVCINNFWAILHVRYPEALCPVESVEVLQKVCGSVEFHGDQ